MPILDDRLTVGDIPAKFDRVYRARAREGDAVYEVNVARLTCSCPEFVSQRSAFPSDDARRVCAHLYDKLCSTKVERAFGPIAQLFIRYGRGMLSYRVVQDDLGTLVIGEPFEPGVVRALGIVGGQPALATYNVRAARWVDGESELGPEVRGEILKRLKASLPSVFGV